MTGEVDQANGWHNMVRGREESLGSAAEEIVGTASQSWKNRCGAKNSQVSIHTYSFFTPGMSIFLGGLAVLHLGFYRPGHPEARGTFL